MTHKSRAKRSVGVLMMGVAVLALALAGLFSQARPAKASTDYEIVTTNVSTITDVIYAVPREKVTLKLAVRDWSTSKSIKVKEYVVSSSIKGLVASGNTIVINKAPKSGKYSIKVTARGADGEKLTSKKFKLVVKKKPNLKIVMTTQDNNGNLISRNATSVRQGGTFFFIMRGADFGWDNCTKKPFYTWSVKNLSTGKTAKWNTKYGSFKKNSFVSGSSVAGGGVPTTYGNFKQKGTYKVTATMYHSNKKFVTTTKTITVN